ncbi:MAG TPA: heparan-alpha-glucosaminide N-acetyltransferase domain-containing protein [Pseudomonadota bacterium]|nr:heparan-alpha-glucosaminide N-acetyltransferase domain-containing protein [Pseudomonadota bacterium]
MAAQRFGFIDWFRGLACVLMIQTHAYDAWTSEPFRRGTWWVWARFKLGGLPARMFLFLAGVSLAMRFASDARKSVSPNRAQRGAFFRGVEVWLFGYGFRITEWLFAGAKLKDAASMFKVDVLQCIGLSLMISAFVASPKDLSDKRIPWRPLLLALFVAAIVPTLQKWGAPSGPGPLIAYLWPGAHPLAQFPLLPWLSYTLTGAAVGVLWLRAAAKDRLAAAMVWTALAGVLLWLCGYGLEKLHLSVFSSTPTVSVEPPFIFLYRTAFCLIGTSASYLLERAKLTDGFSPMRLMGQASLLVYMVHLDLVYNSAPWTLKQRLDPGTSSMLWIVIAILMVVVAWFRVQSDQSVPKKVNPS